MVYCIINSVVELYPFVRLGTKLAVVTNLAWSVQQMMRRGEDGR